MAPNVVPMQGVQPAAKNTPSNADEPKPTCLVAPDHCGRVSRYNSGMRTTPSVARPNTMTTTPPTLLRIGLRSYSKLPSTVAAPPHTMMKIAEKPSTNATAWVKTCQRVAFSPPEEVEVATLGSSVTLSYPMTIEQRSVS